MKRCFCLFFAVFLLLSMPVFAQEGEPVLEEGIQYSVSQGEVTITGYTGTATALKLPSVIEGYPVSDVLWIGLFIVHADHKRGGFGKKCFESLIEAYKGTEIKRIRLSVQDNNLTGFGFWKQVGFSIIDETDCGNFTNLTMEYVI